MQFSKFLPTLLVVVGIGTWTFIAAQDENPEATLSPPRPITRYARPPEMDRQYGDEPEEVVSESDEYEVAVPQRRTRVRNVNFQRPLATEIAELALGAAPAKPTLVSVSELLANGTVSPTPLTAGATTKQTVTQIKVKTVGPAATDAISVILNVKNLTTQAEETRTVVKFDPATTDPNLRVFSFDFTDFRGEGPIELTAAVAQSASPTATDPASPPSDPLVLVFQKFDLPPIQIKWIKAFNATPVQDATQDKTAPPASNLPLYTNGRFFRIQFVIDAPKTPATSALLMAQKLNLQLLNGGDVLATLPSTLGTGLTSPQNFELPESVLGALSLGLRYSVDQTQPNSFTTGFSAVSAPSPVVIDRTPPQMIDARLISDSQLEITFRENDLAGDAATKTFYQIAKASDKPAGNSDGISGGTQVANRVRLNITPLTTGVYKITPHVTAASTNGTPTPASGIMDLAGNMIAEDNIVTFNSFPDRERGTHVPFPEFTVRADRDKTKVFNPGNKVETRVARLYYYRDAHRVAEIVNRNVKSFNRAAVKVAEQLAEQSRDDADRITGERQEKERQAIFDAQQTRVFERDIQQQERELAAAQSDLANLQEQHRQVSEVLDEAQQAQQALQDAQLKSALPPPDAPDGAAPVPNPPLPVDVANSREMATIKQRIKIATSLQNNLATKITATTTKITAANGSLSDLQGKATASRRSEFDSRETVAKKEFDEDRARASQFRKEVAAASADPDTYVAGDPNSIDPVTQISISVIGEGLIQLRGPIRGINTIREMISQIDTPVGQVKVGIHTVQINGEHGDRMETVAARIEASLKLGQNLTSQSLMLLRRAIQEVAAEMVDLTNSQIAVGHRQVDRDRRYLYSFFGRDFTDELYEMDSEFLRTENKLLGLHSMDTLSIAQAMFIMALAKNDVRQAILQKFRHLVMCELPEAEWDHRRTTKLLPKKFNTLEEVVLNANARYHFRNLYAFVNAQVTSPDTLTPTQREFLRLAQIFKSQMIAEMEYNQRVMERGLLEDQSNSEDALRTALAKPHQDAIEQIGTEMANAVKNTKDLAASWQDPGTLSVIAAAEAEIQAITIAADRGISDKTLNGILRAMETIGLDDKSMALLVANPKGGVQSDPNIGRLRVMIAKSKELQNLARDPETQVRLVKLLSELKYYIASVVENSDILSSQLKDELRARGVKMAELIGELLPDATDLTPLGMTVVAWQMGQDTAAAKQLIETELSDWIFVSSGFQRMRDLTEDPASDLNEVRRVYEALQPRLNAIINRQHSSWIANDQKLKKLSLDKQTRQTLTDEQSSQLDAVEQRSRQLDQSYTYNGQKIEKLRTTIRAAFEIVRNRETGIKAANAIEKRTRGSLDHRKIMDFHIDEQAEKVVELAEGTRSHIAQMDNYLKRMFIALEDDFQAQFYDPAFEDVRRASRMWDVSLGQVERTTLLGNNRTLMKVSPQATMEFDLPKRHTAIFEAFAAAKAASADYGALMNDPNFLAIAKLHSGSPPVGGDPRFAGQGGAFRDTMQSPSVKNVLPGLGSSPDEQSFSQVASNGTQFGAALEGLIPDPAVFKFETGTGFEIRPVMQPDGSSLVFDFDYMYTTNVREPVRADEKHLGRVKRHYIHTQVQTTSFELREISRYLVALKASRTSRGVPLLEDVPGLGALFRPLPSAEASLQQNIILSQSMAYPTLFDLMGLRWSKHVVDLDHAWLRDSEHVVRGRYKSVRDYTFYRSAENFDGFMDIKATRPDLYRPDLYHQNSYPSPYHPGGYHNPKFRDEQDPTGRRFNVPDNRPAEMRDPYYDPKFRRPVEFDQAGPGQLLTPQSVGPGEPIQENYPTPVYPGTSTAPRNGRSAAREPALMEPNGAEFNDVVLPPPGNPEATSNAGAGEPTAERKSRSGRSNSTASRVAPESVKWVVNEQANTVGRASVSGYKELEPRFLNPPKANKGLPSLKQLVTGSKAPTVQSSWIGSKKPVAQESTKKSAWSRSQAEQVTRH